MIALLNADIWKEWIPQLIAVSTCKGDHLPLRGLIELDAVGQVLFVRAVGNGVNAELAIQAKVEEGGTAVISAIVASMVARSAQGRVQISTDPRSSCINLLSSGLRVTSQRSVVEFPKPKPKAEIRSLNITSEDVEDWAIVDEPTSDARSRDTIWIGICPGTTRLYASSASGPWAAAVRWGHDKFALPISASILRRIKPTAGDIFTIGDGFLEIKRGPMVYRLTPLAEFMPDMYDRMDGIIGPTHTKLQLNQDSITKLRSMLNAAVCGADEHTLVPVSMQFQSGHLFMSCKGSVISTESAVPVHWISGKKETMLCVAGDSIVHTLENIQGTAELHFMEDGNIGAMLIWTPRKVVSIRANIREVQAPIHTDQKKALVQGVQDQESEELELQVDSSPDDLELELQSDATPQKFHLEEPEL